MMTPDSPLPRFAASGPGPHGWEAPHRDGAPAPDSPSGVSIAAFVTALFGLAIVPVALGVAGLLINPTNSRGRVYAVLGIVLGSVEIILWILLLVAVIAPAGDHTDPSEPTGVQAPYAYGDDPELDALYDTCADGTMSACDELYIESPEYSEYEWFGATCGDRSSADALCVDQNLSDEPHQVSLQDTPPALGPDRQSAAAAALRPDLDPLRNRLLERFHV